MSPSSTAATETYTLVSSSQPSMTASSGQTSLTCSTVVWILTTDLLT